MSKTALLALAHGGNGWDEHGCWYITSVSTTLTALCTDQIYSKSEAFGDVLWVSDHVHVENTSLVQTLDHLFWRDTNGRDKQTCAGINDDVDEIVELAFCVVIAAVSLVSEMPRIVSCSEQGQASLLCLARTATDLWKQEVDTKRRILVLEEALELGDLLAKHVWSVSYAADDTDSSCI